MPDLTERQHELRRTRIGASEVGALLGHHPWTDPAKIYARLTGPEPVPKPSAAMAAGHALESAIAHYAADDLGLKIHACRYTYIHSVLPLAASPDYYARDVQGYPPGEGSPGLLEVKLSRDWSDWLDGPPPWYAWQVRAQLLLTDRPWGVLAALVGTSFQVHRIERDAALEAQLLGAVDRFLVDHLMPRIPPPTDDETLTLRWSLGPGETIAGGDLEDRGDLYAALVRQRRRAEAVEAEARARFVRLLAGQTRLVLGNGWSAKVDARGNLRFDVKGRADG